MERVFFTKSCSTMSTLYYYNFWGFFKAGLKVMRYLNVENSRYGVTLTKNTHAQASKNLIFFSKESTFFVLSFMTQLFLHQPSAILVRRRIEMILLPFCVTLFYSFYPVLHVAARFFLKIVKMWVSPLMHDVIQIFNNKYYKVGTVLALEIIETLSDYVITCIFNAGFSLSEFDATTCMG